MRHTQYLPIGAALLSIISLQTGAALAKTAFSTIGPEGMSALRVGIAAIILCCFTKPWRIRCNSSELVNILFFGVTLGLMNLFIYMAFKYMPVGIAISMEVIGPLAVTLLSSRQPKDLISILFAVTGLTLLPIGGNNTSIELLGVVYVGASALFWGLYVSSGSKIASFGSQGFSLGLIVASMFIVPLGINSGVIEKINTDVFAIGCTIAIMSTALPLVLDSFALKYVPKSIFGVLMSASPAVSALAGMVILDELLTLYQWVGIFLISLACMGATMNFKSNVVATN
ncbi:MULTISPECIES: EamA family transporter [Aeromonas]|uniref:EamA family transporter n=1 Tax=Aeromonas TaxID=642 RepID=UPI000332B1F6|nr:MULTISPECIES: EamA family transporter [Aeromonas]AGM44754.1 hypothetical protein AHML_14930 [Aeromonas hydrophila ML09-119]ALQ62820.1 threonine transporter [Aeromonas hydrophila]ALZ79520.1 threonine transporter [Aeromonas hydrophila]ANR99502.1 threonine/homoserine exporter RhtA [Aeromonas hydrophila]AXV29429.1 threonine/homoserine exporter RhtA [Aeromonas hydrophila]